MVFGRFRVVATLLAGAVLLAGVAGMVNASPGASASAGTGGGAVSLLPAALQAPWSERAGYLPDLPGPLTNVTPLSESSLSVALTLWPRDLDLFAFAEEPGEVLSATQFESEYSPTPSQYAELEAYFTSEGLHLLHTDSERMTLAVAGSSAAVERAFGTGIDSASYEGRPVEFPTATPSLPAPFESEVASVSGLSGGFDQFSLNFHSVPLPAASTSEEADPAQGRTTTLVSPEAVHLIYDVSALYNVSAIPRYAGGQGIALVLWGDGYDPSDIATFFSQYYPSDFPQPQIAPLPVDGAPAPSAAAVGDPSQAPLELTLDLEWAGSEAPGATLYPVYAPDGPASDSYSPSDQGLEDALSQAIQEPDVHVVSMSFATADGSDISFQAAFSSDMARGSSQGITFVAASGDNGGDSLPKGGCNGQVQPEFPAASPLALAVGGTAPVLDQSLTGAVTGLASEAAWSNSGGGFSTDYPAPVWQTTGESKPIIEPNGNRGIPDVAGPASLNFLFFNGAAGAGNGTSFAAPTWAGIVAEMDAIRGTPFGSIAPNLYSIANGEIAGTEAVGIVPITSGGNCVASAAPSGWDAATGWGSPRAFALYEDLVASFVIVDVTTPAGAVAPGGSVEATVVIANSTSHAPIAGVLVNVTLGTPGYTGPCGGPLAVSGGNTSSNGSLSIPLSIPGCYLGSHATVTATVTADGLYGSASDVIEVNLLGLASFLIFLEQFPYNLIAFAGIMIAATAGGWAIGTYR
ncbi:MAG: S53 family peptidase, partial [Thermoplasmata archaeon]